MFEWIVSPEAWVALATLTALEIVLGIDNVIFISIIVNLKLPVRLPINLLLESALRHPREAKLIVAFERLEDVSNLVVFAMLGKHLCSFDLGS